MLSLVLFMLGVLVLSGLIVAYVAYPHRGQRLPAAPWLGDAMRRGVRAMPTIDKQDGPGTEQDGQGTEHDDRGAEHDELSTRR